MKIFIFTENWSSTTKMQYITSTRNLSHIHYINGSLNKATKLLKKSPQKCQGIEEKQSGLKCTTLSGARKTFIYVEMKMRLVDFFLLRKKSPFFQFTTYRAKCKMHVIMRNSFKLIFYMRDFLRFEAWCSGWCFISSLLLAYIF